MARILSIDYGLKKVGIAVTDPLQIIAYPLKTVDNCDIFKFLDEYFMTESVEKIIVGDPVIFSNEENISESIDVFVKKLKSVFPNKEVILFNERYTTNIAKYYIQNSGFKKKDRSNKYVFDRVSASIILQSYLNSVKNY